MRDGHMPEKDGDGGKSLSGSDLLEEVRQYSVSGWN